MRVRRTAAQIVSCFQSVCAQFRCHICTHLHCCSLFPYRYEKVSRAIYILHQEEAEDQAGFRSSYQTTDHFATYRMTEQKCHEWSIKMWIATIDFTSAFDSITHKSIWKTLESCCIDHDYISFLKKLYRVSAESICTD